MKKYRVQYSAAAKRDIELIFQHISHNLMNPISAKAIAERIMQKCDALSLFPESTPVRLIRHGREYRFIQTHNYVIVYTVSQSVNEVMIHRVLYTRRNINAILALLTPEC